MQAAIGLEQMKKRRSADRSSAPPTPAISPSACKGLPGIQTPVEPEWGDRVYFYYVIRLDRKVLGADMLSFAAALAAEGVYDLGYISTTRWIIPQHLEPVFRQQGGLRRQVAARSTASITTATWNTAPAICPVAEEACDEVFWLASVHPLLEQRRPRRRGRCRHQSRH